MLTQKAVDIFKIIQDKYGSPDVIDSEIIKYLNMATYEWLNRLIPDSQGGVVNFEFGANTASQVQPLMHTVELELDATGMITDEQISDKLKDQVGDQCAEVFKILNVAVDVDTTVEEVTTTTTYPAKYVSHNNILAYQRNVFKAASPKKPLYTLLSRGYQFYPTTADGIRMTVLKSPTELALTPKVVNPELEDYTMYSIIMIALKLAGVATRDEELIMQTRNVGLQIAQ